MALQIAYGNTLENFGGTSNFSFTGTTNDDLANITDHDHSYTFTGSSGGTIDFGEINKSPEEIDALCISGLVTVGTVSIYGGSTLIESISNPGGSIFVVFPLTNVDIKIEFTSPFTLGYVSLARVYNIESGEQAGFNRNYLNSHKSTRTVLNMQAAPVSSLIENKPLKGALTLPHFPKADVGDFLNIFYGYHPLNGSRVGVPFFIREDEADVESSYTCFDADVKVKAHSQTLSLNSISLNYKVFNGS